MQLYLWYGPSDFTSHQLPCLWKAYPSIIEVYQRDCPIIPTHLCIFPCFIYGSLLQCWRIKHNQRSMHQNCCSPLMGLWQFFYFSASWIKGKRQYAGYGVMSSKRTALWRSELAHSPPGTVLLSQALPVYIHRQKSRPFSCPEK